MADDGGNACHVCLLGDPVQLFKEGLLGADRLSFRGLLLFLYLDPLEDVKQRIASLLVPNILGMVNPARSGQKLVPKDFQ